MARGEVWIQGRPGRGVVESWEMDLTWAEWQVLVASPVCLTCGHRLCFHDGETCRICAKSVDTSIQRMS